MYNHAPKDYKCPLCLFIEGKEDETVIPNHKYDTVYQDEMTTAFVSPKWFPTNKGHVIVIPNKHFENMYDIEPEYAHAIADTAQKVALALKDAYQCDGISTRQHNEPAGNQDVFHYHLHVVPRYKDDTYYQLDAKKEWVPEEARIPYALKLRAYFATLT
jgi:histidine triad (HIT) family protein